MGKYFGTDGIRGFANKTLNVDTVYNIGRFIGNYYLEKGKRIVVGKDPRLSSDMFEHVLAAGISASGSDVYLLGYCTTPSMAFVCKSEKFSVGVMISASHNPYHDNGIKLFSNSGIKIDSNIEGLIEEYIDNPVGIPLAIDEEIGRVIEYKVGIDHYVEFLDSKFDFKDNNFKILVDLANGSACYTAKKVYDSLGIKVDYINDNPNGININNDCGSTHLEAISATIKNGDYDIGFAFDGDADRMLAVNNFGDVIDGDKIMYVLARYLKENNKLINNTLVLTVMSNFGLFKALKKVDINTKKVAVGDKNVLDAMLNEDYYIGGEQSGHIINRYYTVFGDGVLTSLMILSVMHNKQTTIDSLIEDVKVYPQLLKNVHTEKKEELMLDDGVKKAIVNVEKKINNNGRVLVRPSGTEPLLRVMVEAETDELCNEYVEEIIGAINKVK